MPLVSSRRIRSEFGFLITRIPRSAQTIARTLQVPGPDRVPRTVSSWAGRDVGRGLVFRRP